MSSSNYSNKKTDTETFSHRARKRFGQNFLHDPHIIRRIIAAVAPQPQDHVVEIGPGQGALTTYLVDACGQLDAIELDRDLAAYLGQLFAQKENLTIHQHDVLKYDFDQLASTKELRIIGNLPYNISTPVMFHLLRYHHLIKDMSFMLQLEVVQRLCAVKDTKNYGRLSLMVQYYCEVEHLFNVPPEAFNPRPKVMSAIVRLKPYKNLPIQAKSVRCLQDVIRGAFNQRRKTIRNSMKSMIEPERLSELGIDLKLRPENLSLAEYVIISDALFDSPNTGSDTGDSQ